MFLFFVIQVPVFEPTVDAEMHNFGNLNLNGFEQNFISYL
jgi:hypothetical protein